MPTGIDNSLPSASLILGILEDNGNKMRMLVETGAAMNTGNLRFHMWVMFQYPDIVDDRLQCGKDTAYDAEHLLADLDLNDIDTDASHDQMTAVIRYKTPYTVDGKGPFILSFVLSNDVNLRSVLGLPTLLVMGANINLVKGLLSCIELNCSFPLELQHPDKVYPKALLSIITHPLFPLQFPLT